MESKGPVLFLLRCFAVAVFFAGLNAPTPVFGFASSVLESVVAVLPHWTITKRSAARDAPEGTAVAVLDGGYLATNVHVLGDATMVDIRLGDGRLIAVEIVGRDAKTDIALLKAPRDFPVLEVAPPPGLGEAVCAVGNQFGLGLSVTCGVVSATGRSNTGFNAIEDFIQTDAAVNPGGSGGALIDDQGRIVGLVSAIFTKRSDANIGVNFASSMALVNRVVADLRRYGEVRAATAGIDIAPLTSDQRRKSTGVTIVNLDQDGPGLAGGFQIGDVVTAVGKRRILRPSDFYTALYLAKPGDEIGLSYVRDGKSARITIRLMP